MKKHKIYKAAMAKWGFKMQVVQLAEEAGEIVRASMKVIKRGYIETSEDNFIEEIADMEIMLEQMRECLSYYHIQELESIKKEKLTRLEVLVK